MWVTLLLAFVRLDSLDLDVSEAVLGVFDPVQCSTKNLRYICAARYVLQLGRGRMQRYQGSGDHDYSMNHSLAQHQKPKRKRHSKRSYKSNRIPIIPSSAQ
jgi:hypothetical protein